MPSRLAGPRRLPRLLVWLASLLAIAALLWTAAWFYAAHFAAARITAWMEREKTHGRVWTCPEQMIAGFPFAMKVSCVQPALQAVNNGKSIAGALGGLVANFSVFQPDRISITLAGPLTVANKSTGQALALEWSALACEIRILPAGLAAADATIRNPALEITAADSAAQTLRAENAEVHILRAAGRSEAERAFDVRVKAKSAVVPALDALLRSTDAIQADAAFVVTQAGLGSEPDMLSRLEIWRRAGGRLEIANSSLVKGTLALQARGTMALDAAHRPEGELETDAAGIEDIAAQFGLPLASLKIGGLLAGMTGAPAPAANPKALHLSLKFREGRVYLGPIKTPLKLNPLY